MTVETRSLTAELAEIVGAAHVLTEQELISGFVTDWTRRWTGYTTAVVRPANTGEVAAVLAACHRARVAVVPQGGNTGLVGGSVPMHGEIVLSTVRLNRIDRVDPVGRTIDAGAGVTVAEAQRAARHHGLDFGIDLASRDSATMGGIVSTNAGGIRMIKNGNTRAQLLGVEAVLADGTVFTRWKELTKDNVGYDLPGLLAGAEGTLAVITRVRMKLVVPPRATKVALVGVESVGGALGFVDTLQRSGLALEAAELMTRSGIDLVMHHKSLRAPFAEDAPFALLVEVSGQADAQQLLLDALTAGESVIVDASIEDGPAHRLWNYRESHTEAVSAVSTTPPVKLDLSTPLREIESFLAELTVRMRDAFPGVRAICFGHIGDGNIHVNLLDVADDQRESVTDMVLRLVARHDGSISAEHGVGRAKAPWIGLGRTPVDLQLMRAIRSALDPAGILNPAILPANPQL